MEEKFICEFCGKEFNTQQALSGHSGNCKDNPKNKDQVFECQYCHRTDFTSKSGFKFHENHCSQKSDYVKIHIVKPKTACQYCGKLIENANLKKHEEACCNPESKLNRKKMQVKDYNEDLTCRYCGKQYKDAGNLVKHEKQECLLNPSITDEMQDQRHQDYLMRYINASDESKEAMKWNKGKTKETNTSILKYSQTLINYYQKHPEAVYNKFGNFKFGWYQCIPCDSSWELAFLVYCLENNIDIKRNFKSFDYKDTDGLVHKYFPDFIVNNEFYEIKGFYRESDYLKIDQFPIKLNIIDINNINKYLSYVKNKYGNNFTEVLYDKDKPSYLTQKDKLNYKVINKEA